MKQIKKGDLGKPTKKKIVLTPEQREAIWKYLDKQPVSYTVHTVAEYIRPEVKAYWEKERAKNSNASEKTTGDQ